MMRVTAARMSVIMPRNLSPRNARREGSIAERDV